MKKKFLSVCGLFVTILMGASVFAQNYDFQEGDFYYKINSNGSSVTLTRGDSAYGVILNIDIPEKIENNGTEYVVTAIDDSAFAGAITLEVTMPNTITSIGDSAFAGCTMFNITLSENISTIENYTFFGCGLLNNIVLPDKVKKIGMAAFGGCASMTNITLGAGLQQIDYIAFAMCSSLDTIICKGKLPATLNEYGDYVVFYEVDQYKVTCIVPCGQKDAYQSAEGWKWFNIQEDCGQTNGIEDIAEQNVISVYPNPASDNVTIKARGKVVIMNALGQIVKTINNAGGTQSIDISDLPSGIYSVRCGNIVKKLVVK